MMLQGLSKQPQIIHNTPLHMSKTARSGQSFAATAESLQFQKMSVINLLDVSFYFNVIFL